MASHFKTIIKFDQVLEDFSGRKVNDQKKFSQRTPHQQKEDRQRPNKAHRLKWPRKTNSGKPQIKPKSKENDQKKKRP